MTEEIKDIIFDEKEEEIQKFRLEDERARSARQRQNAKSGYLGDYTPYNRITLKDENPKDGESIIHKILETSNNFLKRWTVA